MILTLKQENLIDTDFGKSYQYCESAFYGNSIDGCTEIMHKGEDVVKVTNGDNVAIYCLTCHTKEMTNPRIDITSKKEKS
tara:strand:- start:69 stop:308 length:240 start_codon:yes stop_codon:yes gene_type:complete